MRHPLFDDANLWFYKCVVFCTSATVCLQKKLENIDDTNT